MATRTITIHDTCTTPGCNRMLFSIREAEAGQCSTCWFKTMDPAKKKALNRLIACAFDRSNDKAKDSAVADAMVLFDEK